MAKPDLMLRPVRDQPVEQGIHQHVGVHQNERCQLQVAKVPTVRDRDVVPLHDEQRTHGILDLALLRQTELLGRQGALEEHQSCEGMFVSGTASEFVHLLGRGELSISCA